MSPSPLLTLLNRLAGKLALPLALVVLLAGLPGVAPAAPHHRTSVTAQTDPGGDATILEKRPTPLTLAELRLGGFRTTKTDGKSGLPPSSFAHGWPARDAALVRLPADPATDPPWRRHHRLPAHTGPPAG